MLVFQATIGTCLRLRCEFAPARKKILESVVKGVRTAEKMAVFQATIGT